MKKVAILDPTSRTLPYCYYYLKALSQYMSIDFFCSATKYNAEYIDLMKELPNVTVRVFGGENSNIIVRVVNYLYMLLICKSKINIYHSINFQWSVMPQIDQFIFLLFRGKLVFTLHNDVPHNYTKATFKPFVKICKIASGIIFVSESTKKIFVKNYGDEFNSKLNVLAHGAMPFLPSFPSYKKEINVTSELVFWGSVKDYKGVDLLYTQADVFKKHGFNIKVFGKFDSESLSTKAALLSKGIYVRDEFLDSFELQAMFKQSDICLILPYKRATQSGVMYNAIFYCVPFICSNTGEMADVLKSFGLEGLVFERDSQESLEKSLLFLRINQPYIQGRLEKIRNKFNWQYAKESVISAYVYGDYS